MCPPAKAQAKPGLVWGWYAGYSTPFECMAYPVSPSRSANRLTPPPRSGRRPWAAAREAAAAGEASLNQVDIDDGEPLDAEDPNGVLVETHAATDFDLEVGDAAEPAQPFFKTVEFARRCLRRGHVKRRIAFLLPGWQQGTQPSTERCFFGSHSCFVVFECYGVNGFGFFLP